MPIVPLARTVPGFSRRRRAPDREGREGVTHAPRPGYRFSGSLAVDRASTTKRRLDGYRASYATHLPVDLALVAEGDFKVESAYRAGLEMLKHRPDVVFIANYLMRRLHEGVEADRLRCPTSGHRL